MITLIMQIIDWLSHSPTEIESYIRPGCIVLTIYLRLEKSMWEEVCFHCDARMIAELNIRKVSVSSLPYLFCVYAALLSSGIKFAKASRCCQ